MWISVKDRLPEVNEPVLMRVTCCDYHNIEQGHYQGYGKWVNCWYSMRNEGLYPVTHWMPLPAPPTAEAEEGANLQHTTGASQN